MRQNKPWRECVSGDLFWVGIAVLAAGVLIIMFFRAASMIDPRRADGYDEMIVFLASHSFLMIPCAVFVLLGINAAIVGGIRLFRQEAPFGGLPGAWRKRTEAARDGFREGSRTTVDEEGIISARPDDGGFSADAFSPKLPPG
ncbi:MAG TPA: hypothetical protein VH643_04525 [Gemmataceae bacterium]